MTSAGRYRLPLADLPDPLPVTPLPSRGRASVRPPGSKSITNRVYAIAALAEGESRLTRHLRADDTDRLRAALERVGVRTREDGLTLVVEGASGRLPGGGAVDLGDGGTPARFMIALATHAAAPVTIDGSPRLRERPMAEGALFLRELGGDVAVHGDGGGLPIEVRPQRAFPGGTLSIPTTSSSQFISALMLIAPWRETPLVLRFEGETTSRRYVELTADVLRAWGVRVDDTGDRLTVTPGPVTGRVFDIEADASSAVYWWTAAAVCPGWTVTTPGVPDQSTQADRAALDALVAMGASPTTGDVLGIASRRPLQGGTVDARGFPDAALALAAGAATATGPTTLTGLRTLRVKETDRIHALATELRRVGCTVAADDDGLVIEPSCGSDTPVVIETYDDHRMAMSFAILGLARGNLAITNPASVAKSYPTFWHDLASLYDGAGGGHTDT